MKSHIFRLKGKIYKENRKTLLDKKENEEEIKVKQKSGDQDINTQ